MSSKINKFMNALSKRGIMPSTEMIADGEMHYYEAKDDHNGTVICWYILSDDPVVGLYGYLGMDDAYRFPTKKKVKVAKKRAIYRAKLQEMRKIRDLSLASDGKKINEKEVVDGLSGLDDFAYDRVRIKEANGLKIRPATLDKAVAEARKAKLTHVKKAAWDGFSSAQNKPQQLGLEL